MATWFQLRDDSIPDDLIRVDQSGNTEAYQLGFNRHNTCWLRGDWVPCTDATAHRALYANLQQEHSGQRPSGPTSIDGMTKAQRQAWEHFSGLVLYYYIDRSGKYGSALCATRRDSEILERYLAEIRDNGWRVIRLALAADGSVTDALEYAEFPEDLLAEISIPLDVEALLLIQDEEARDGKQLFPVWS